MFYLKIKTLATASKIIHDCCDRLTNGNFPVLLIENMCLIGCKTNSPGYEIVKEENLIYILLFSPVWKPDPYSWRGV